MTDPATGAAIAERLLHGLQDLVLASTRLHPEDVDDRIRSALVGPGISDAAVWVVDLEQRALHGLSEDRPSHPVDGSAAGEAYRREQHAFEETPEGDHLVWVPLMDSAERVGVVMARVDHPPTPEVLEGISAIALFAGELVANKSWHGDHILLRRRTRELTVAAELRWSLLPPMTFSGRNLTITGIVEPPHTIAGDTFDYAVHGDEAHIAIFDAVGHGLEAARIANLAVGTYRSCRRRGLDHAATYHEIDATLLDQFGPEKFATAQLVTVDMRTGQLSWINAGHPPPLVLRDGVAADLPSRPFLPLGLGAMVLDEDPVQSEAALRPGDHVLFFTDGVTEARAENGEQLGRRRLADLACRAVGEATTAAEAARLLGRDLLAHQHGTLADDATMLLLVWDGPPSGGPDAP